jgi:tRNA threonylcarbamoyl adenosine modification protein YeaZ
MPEPLILAIETSNPSADAGAGIALGHVDSGDVKTLGVEPVRAADRHSDDLLPAIDRLASRLGVGPGDLGLVCVSAGPGGYTGLRIAIVGAQMIAEVARARCAAVPTELVVARRVEADGRRFAVCLASKGRTTFARRFGADGRPDGPGRLIDETGVDALDAELIVADRFLPEPMRRRAADLGIRIAPPLFDPVAALELAPTLGSVEPVRLRAIYPREPDAVTQWRRLHAEAPDLDNPGETVDKS